MLILSWQGLLIALEIALTVLIVSLLGRLDLVLVLDVASTAVLLVFLGAIYNTITYTTIAHARGQLER